MAPKKNKPVMFKFIDVGDAAPERKKQNESIARSHVMTEFRKVQREIREKKKREQRLKEELGIGCSSVSFFKSESDASSVSEYSSSLNTLLRPGEIEFPGLDGLLEPGEPSFQSVAWSMCLSKNISSISVSRDSFLEGDLSAVLESYSGKVTPYLSQLIDHRKCAHSFGISDTDSSTVIQYQWGKFWPSRSPDEASPLAREWWPLFSSIPTVFHTFVYAAAVHYDDLHLTTSMSQTREILAHKCEAIHQLRQALAQLNGALPRDAIILAMTYLGLATTGDSRKRIEDNETTPFSPPEPVNTTLWRRQFLQTTENVHIATAKRLIDMKGGLDGRCFILAKTNFWYINS
jgi:hypothetical protein